MKKTEIPFFKLSELGAIDERQFHPEFLNELVILRKNIGRSFIVTSCARSAEYNKKIGGVEKSLHIYDKPKRKGQKGCMAIDIRILDVDFKVSVIKSALLLGWSVGINDKKRFIHLDRRVDIGEQQTIFSY